MKKIIFLFLILGFGLLSAVPNVDWGSTNPVGPVWRTDQMVLNITSNETITSCQFEINNNTVSGTVASGDLSCFYTVPYHVHLVGEQYYLEGNVTVDGSKYAAPDINFQYKSCGIVENNVVIDAAFVDTFDVCFTFQGTSAPILSFSSGVGMSGGGGTAIFINNTDNAEVDGFDISIYDYGINVTDSDNVWLHDGSMNRVFNGITVTNSDNVQITSADVYSVDYRGISFTGSQNAYIADTNTSITNYSIFMDGADDSRLENVTSYNSNIVGLYMNGSERVNITSLNVSDSVYGVWLNLVDDLKVAGISVYDITNDAIFLASSKNVRISGGSLNDIYNTGYGINAGTISNLTVSNLVFTNCTNSGIYTSYVNDSRIGSNQYIIPDFKTGIELDNSIGVWIDYSTFVGGAAGVYSSSGVNNIYDHLRIRDAENGIYLSGETYFNITSVNSSFNQVGINISLGGNGVIDSSVIYNNSDMGILLRRSSYNYINSQFSYDFRNFIFNNVIGIKMLNTEAEFNNIGHNEIYNNAVGVYQYDSGAHNFIYDSHLYGNVNDFVFYASSNDVPVNVVRVYLDDATGLNTSISEVAISDIVPTGSAYAANWVSVLGGPYPTDYYPFLNKAISLQKIAGSDRNITDLKIYWSSAEESGHNPDGFRFFGNNGVTWDSEPTSTYLNSGSRYVELVGNAEVRTVNNYVILENVTGSLMWVDPTPANNSVTTLYPIKLNFTSTVQMDAGWIRVEAPDFGTPTYVPCVVAADGLSCAVTLNYTMHEFYYTYYLRPVAEMDGTNATGTERVIDYRGCGNIRYEGEKYLYGAGSGVIMNAPDIVCLNILTSNVMIGRQENASIEMMGKNADDTDCASDVACNDHPAITMSNLANISLKFVNEDAVFGNINFTIKGFRQEDLFVNHTLCEDCSINILGLKYETGKYRPNIYIKDSMWSGSGLILALGMNPYSDIVLENSSMSVAAFSLLTSPYGDSMRINNSEFLTQFFLLGLAEFQEGLSYMGYNISYRPTAAFIGPFNFTESYKVMNTSTFWSDFYLTQINHDPAYSRGKIVAIDTNVFQQFANISAEIRLNTSDLYNSTNTLVVYKYNSFTTDLATIYTGAINNIINAYETNYPYSDPHGVGVFNVTAFSSYGLFLANFTVNNVTINYAEATAYTSYSLSNGNIITSDSGWFEALYKEHEATITDPLIFDILAIFLLLWLVFVIYWVATHFFG